jgi:hypothetical protein
MPTLFLFTYHVPLLMRGCIVESYTWDGAGIAESLDPPELPTDIVVDPRDCRSLIESTNPYSEGRLETSAPPETRGHGTLQIHYNMRKSVPNRRPFQHPQVLENKTLRSGGGGWTRTNDLGIMRPSL